MNEMMKGATPNRQAQKGFRSARRFRLRPFQAFSAALLALSCSAAGCAGPEPRSVVLVAAASSLKDVVSELGERFERRTGARVDFNFAGSNILAQQIAVADAVDVFLSADRRWFDFLKTEGRIIDRGDAVFLRNRLVVISHADSQLTLTEPAGLATADFQHLVLANPEAVPAGRYAKAWLEQVSVGAGSLWDVLAPKVAPALDVRAALALVASDPAMLGVVYASDQLVSDRTRVIFEPAPSEQPAIEYCAALISRQQPSSVAADFYTFLMGEEARAAFRDHGFEVPE